MGISINGARFLAHAASKGLVLGRTTVVGRQGLFAPPSLLRQILVRHGLEVKKESENFFQEMKAEWADSLFFALGATSLEFLDASGYEGATRLHDLNHPIVQDWEETTDTLIDSGSLEHVFDVKTAVENYLRLVRVGGSILLLDMPAVNFCGHGFYQFSPEFFCEVFSEKHGFELQTLALSADWGYAPFYSASRPRDKKGRVEPTSSDPCHLFVRARKIRSFSGLEHSIVQSDYAETWKAATSSITGGVPRNALAEALRALWRWVSPAGYWRFSTRRNCRRKLRASAINKGLGVIPLDI